VRPSRRPKKEHNVKKSSRSIAVVRASRRSRFFRTSGGLLVASLLVAAGALGACKKKEPGPAAAAAAATAVAAAKHSCDRRVGSKLCVEYLGAAGTEAYVTKECGAIANAKYIAGTCPAGSIGRCAKFVGTPAELHELHYQGNFEVVKKMCEGGGGAFTLTK